MSGQAEDDLDGTPVGAVVRAPEGGAIGHQWIFIGWHRNTQRQEMIFVREVLPNDRTATPYIYHASMTDTLIRKFPDLSNYRRIWSKK